MDQHDVHNTPYDAPVVEDLETTEGPATVAAGNNIPTQINTA
jgi:hypothetical protein